MKSNGNLKKQQELFLRQVIQIGTSSQPIDDNRSPGGYFQGLFENKDNAWMPTLFSDAGFHMKLGEEPRTTNTNQPPMHYIAESESIEKPLIFSYMLFARGGPVVDITRRDDAGNTALHVLAAKNPEVIAYIEELGQKFKDINDILANNPAPNMMQVFANYPDILKEIKAPQAHLYDFIQEHKDKPLYLQKLLGLPKFVIQDLVKMDSSATMARYFKGVSIQIGLLDRALAVENKKHETIPIIAANNGHFKDAMSFIDRHPQFESQKAHIVNMAKTSVLPDDVGNCLNFLREQPSLLLDANQQFWSRKLDAAIKAGNDRVVTDLLDAQYVSIIHRVTFDDAKLFIQKALATPDKDGNTFTHIAAENLNYRAVRKIIDIAPETSCMLNTNGSTPTALAFDSANRKNEYAAETIYNYCADSLSKAEGLDTNFPWECLVYVGSGGAVDDVGKVFAVPINFPLEENEMPYREAVALGKVKLDHGADASQTIHEAYNFANQDIDNGHDHTDAQEKSNVVVKENNAAAGVGSGGSSSNNTLGVTENVRDRGRMPSVSLLRQLNHGVAGGGGLQVGVTSRPRGDSFFRPRQLTNAVVIADKDKDNNAVDQSSSHSGSGRTTPLTSSTTGAPEVLLPEIITTQHRQSSVVGDVAAMIPTVAQVISEVKALAASSPEKSMSSGLEGKKGTMEEKILAEKTVRDSVIKQGQGGGGVAF